MINIYRQCGVVHVDDRIHILFIMSKINLRRKYRIRVSLIPYKLLTSIYCFLGLAPFYANMIIWMKLYLRHAIQLSNMIMQIIYITIFACIIIVFFVSRICFDYHTNHIRITPDASMIRWKMNIFHCVFSFLVR